MGRILAELVDNKIIVTRYDINNSIIPEKISQDSKVVEIISRNLDTDKDIEIDSKEKAVLRIDFLSKLLGMLGEGYSDKYHEYCSGLYSVQDMKKGITWSEVAYLLYYVGGLDKKIDWRSIKPEEGYKVCVLKDIVNERKIINEKLAMYKTRLDMEYYINSIRLGKRCIPLPLYCAYADLISRDELGVDLSLSMMFKKVSEEEVKLLF